MKKRIKIFLMLVVSLTILSIVVIYFIGSILKWWRTPISERNEISEEQYLAIANEAEYTINKLEMSLKIRASLQNNIVDDVVTNNYYYCMDLGSESEIRFFRIQILDSEEEDDDEDNDSTSSISFDAKNLGSRTFIIKVS